MFLDISTISHLATRGGVASRWLFWVSARNRSTGLPETAGFWTGGDTRSFTVEGEPRVYMGAGGLVGLQPLTYESGSVVRIQTLQVSPVKPDVEQMFRGHDMRLAPVEIHLMVLDPDTLVPISINRAFRGRVDTLKVITPDVGGVARMDVNLASVSRRMTKKSSAKKSHATQFLRSNDAFRRYGDVSGAVPVWWGETKHLPETETDATETSTPVQEGDTGR